MPSYSSILTMPSWLLLDEDKNIVASIRAPNANATRMKLKGAGYKGAYLRYDGHPKDQCTCGHDRMFHANDGKRPCSLCGNDMLLCGGFAMQSGQ